MSHVGRVKLILPRMAGGRDETRKAQQTLKEGLEAYMARAYTQQPHPAACRIRA